ncbi:hypothetical protein ABZ401_07220 [Streptomyces sp. NPDC005892]|uniref:D-alanyl-D-alanine carboxypeptidase n=1 Tax=Streptomyces sp. NPDC005892 TaxID=3155593 RepID=UPI0034115221
MAGESPGKSEQRKSSGTAPEERDPRLSVFREPTGPSDDKVGDAADADTGSVADAPDEESGAGADAESDEESGTDAGSSADAESSADASSADVEPEADSRTAVFRFRVPVPSADDATDETVTEATAESTDGSTDAASEGDVAPVTDATADAPADATADATAGATVGAPAEAEDGAPEAPEGPTGPPEADSVPSGASGAQKGAASAPAAGTAAADDEASDDVAEGERAEGESGEGESGEGESGEGESGEGESGEGESGGGDGDTRLRRAVAAWVGKDGKDDSSAAAAEEPAGAVKAAEPTEDEKPGAAEPTGDEKPEDAKAAGDEKPEVEKLAGDEKPEVEKPAGDEKPEVATAGAQVPRTREEATPTEPASAATGAGDTADSETPDRGAGGAEGEDEGADDPGIDQPTAVFTSARARIDQPTTALKIPQREALTKPDPDPEQAPKPETDPDAGSKSAPKSGSKSGPEPESPSERTSTFVPLRSDDVRSAPAPRRPDPQGPVVGPTVTPAVGTPTPAEPDRTRAMPLPPKPPLDLLAELTNTPPPEETPVRTAVRRVKIWTPLVLLLVVVFALVQMFRPLPDPTLAVTTTPTYTFEGATPDLSWPDQGQGYMAATGLGKVGSFGKQKPVPIASVAKAMTAYIVLRDHPMKKGADGESIKVDAKGESDGKLSSEGESTLDTVKEGDVLTQREALSAIMIPSANNIARLLARWDAGSEKAFVAKMNATAKELGMVNTTYTDPSGLNATTVSTAEDLVKLGEKLVEIPALMEITVLPSWTDPTGKPWPNYNRLVPYDGALGIKTGSTTKAGGNLLFAAHKMIDGTDQLIVGAILGQYDSQSIIDEVNRVSKTVMVATEDALKGATIVKKGQVVGVVDDGLGSTTEVVATKDVKAVGWGGLTVKLELTDDGKVVPHEAAAGTRVGTLTVGEGSSQVKVPVALAQDLSEPGFGAKLSRIG